MEYVGETDVHLCVCETRRWLVEEMGKEQTKRGKGGGGGGGNKCREAYFIPTQLRVPFANGTR